LSELSKEVLADTSVWIEFFKPCSPDGDHLEVLISRNSVIVCGIVLFELLQGVKSEAEKARISGILTTLPYIEMTERLWRQAALLSVSLRKKGVAVPLSDILISSLAIEKALPIFTLDQHFEQIPGVRLYKSEYTASSPGRLSFRRD
jgi:predicted nucleic acid-binding protein